MTRPPQAKLDFILQFVEEYPSHGREACVQAAGALLRLAKRRQALALAECNPPAHWERYNVLVAARMRDDWDDSIARRKAKLAERIAEVCAPFKLRYHVGGDPRGAVLRVEFPSGRGNCIGNARQWAVPT